MTATQNGSVKAIKTPKRKYNKALILAVLQASVIALTIAFAAGFLVGKHYEQSQNHLINTKATQLSRSLR